MRKTYKSLNAGELSPQLYGRYDVEKYGVGCSSIYNFTIDEKGGLQFRAGLRFIGEVDDSSKKSRLQRFEFSDVQAYALEFSENKLRFYRNEGQILDTAQNITAITQANPAQVTISGHGFSTGQEVYLADIVGMTELNTRNAKITVVDTNNFTLDGIDSTGFTAYTSGGTAAPVYELATTFSETQIMDVYTSQSADVMTLCHGDYDPQEITRTGHTSWTLTDITFEPEISAPSSVSATASAGSGSTTYEYKVTAVQDETFEESYISTATGSVTNNLGTVGNTNTVSWGAVTGAVQYNIYKNSAGTYGFIGTSESTSFIDDNIAPDTSRTAPRARTPFDGAGNKPRVCGFQAQRRVFASTKNKPDTVFMTRAGLYDNLTVSIPNQDDDAITFAIASGEPNRINHLVSFRDLLAFTVGAEWMIKGEPTYAPTNMNAEPQTEYGSAGDGTDFDPVSPAMVKPIKIGATAIFIGKYGRSIHDYAYTFELEGYDGNDLTVLAEHLFEDRQIINWAYAKHPNGIIWCVCDDGTLLSLTYLKEHRVWGWARHGTDGEFEAVCTVPNPEKRKDSVYFIVKRTINGQTKRYIEILEDYIDKDTDDSFFVDSGLSYDGSPTNTVSGLWHLEGKDVAILADGNVLPLQTVTDGRITLESNYSKIHVGLPYYGEAAPMPHEGESGGNGTKGIHKRIQQMNIEVYKTRGLKVGQDGTDEILSEMQPTFESGDLASDIESFTGLVELPVQSYYNKNYVTGYFRQDYPLPAKVLSLTVDFE